MSGNPVSKSPVVKSFPSSSFQLPSDENRRNAVIFCSLLAVQFGLQPMIASKFIGKGVSKSSVVIATEAFKILAAIINVLTSTNGYADWERFKSAVSLTDSLQVSALPAFLYSIQNVCIQYGFLLLDSMTFNLLNQTKTVSAAIWLYVLMGQTQSPMQVVALFLLMISAVLLNVGQNTSSSMVNESGLGGYQLGVVMVAVASLISGLTSGLTQRALTGRKSVRSPILMSGELAIYGIMVLFVNLLLNKELDLSHPQSFFSNWTWYTLIPGFGGIIVGQVTKFAGGVVKGFALIAGIAITGIAQWLIDGKPLGLKDLAAIGLVSLAIYLHAKYPAPKKVTEEKKKE